MKTLARHLAVSLLSLFIISLLSFALMELAPGSPMDRYAGNPRVSPADRARMAERFGLNEPAHRRYLLWLINIGGGDLGVSHVTGRPVMTEISERLPATLLLMGTALALSLFFSVFVGVYCAAYKNSIFDRLLTAGTLFGLSMPTFFLGLLMIYIFSVQLQILPAGGRMAPWFDPSLYPLPVRPLAAAVEAGRHLLMPAFVLSICQTSAWSRYMRSAMLSAMEQNYIRTARAKGVKQMTIVYRHALRNALIPLATMFGLELPALFAGAAITEHIFAWPGMGRLFISSIGSRDYQVILGITMITALLVLAGNLLADVIYRQLDPRIKYGEER